MVGGASGLLEVVADVCDQEERLPTLDHRTIGSRVNRKHEEESSAGTVKVY